MPRKTLRNLGAYTYALISDPVKMGILAEKLPANPEISEMARRRAMAAYELCGLTDSLDGLNSFRRRGVTG